MSGTDTASRALGIASRAEVDPFIAMDVMADAQRLEAQGRHVVHMEVGEPGFAVPAAVRAAAEAALARGRLGYTQALGIPELRAAIARHYGTTYGLDVAPSRIAVTTGSSTGFVLTFLALFEPGDRIAIASPGYPPYRTILKALGLVPVEIETGAATRWALTAEAIAAAHREAPLAGVLAMSPANPTGTMIGRAALAHIAGTCRELGIRLVSDEIYHGLTFEEDAASMLAFDPQAVVVNSFSKYFCMTGWRVGWLVLPEGLDRTFERLAQNLFISVAELSQRAALGAFEAREELEANRAAYARCRRMILDGFPKAGLASVLPIDGAFYAYADVGHLTNESLAFARAMLHEAGVAATPGLDFDRTRGARFMRFSFAGGEEAVAEAIARIGAWLRR